MPSGLGLLPVDRLSSFVPFGLRLILQRLTEEPKRPRVCCSPTPLQSGPKPTKTPSIISVVRSRSRGRKPCSIWSLLAPSTYKKASPPKFLGHSTPNPSPAPLRAAGHIAATTQELPRGPLRHLPPLRPGRPKSGPREPIVRRRPVPSSPPADLALAAADASGLLCCCS